jgi:hypothetical protein
LSAKKAESNRRYTPMLSRRAVPEIRQRGLPLPNNTMIPTESLTR